jgi:tetratricopeptide (TPR) repeat protein
MPDRANVAISLAGSACHAWREFSFLEGRQYVDDALALVSDLTPLPIAARLYKQAGTLWYTSDEGRGLRMWEKAADAFRAIPDSSNLAQTLSVIGHLYSRANRNEEAKRVLYEALDLVRSSGDKRLNELITLSGLGVLHSNLREPEEARRLFNEAQHIAQEIGDVVQEQVALANLSELEYQFGDIDRAIDIGNAVIANLRAMPRGGLKQFLRAVTTTVGSYLLIRGRKSEALDKVRDALLLAREEGGLGVTACIELAAYFAAEHQETRQAAEMLGFADARYQATASLRNPSEELVREQVRNRILLEISGSEFESHAKAGQQWTEEHAMEMAETYLA